MDTEADLKTSRMVKENLQRFEAPADLRRKIFDDIARSRRIAPLARLQMWVSSLAGPWTTLSAGVAGGAMAMFLGMHLYLLPPQDSLTEEIASSHVRSLMADHLSDVASSDQHTVKPWFLGKLDYAPPVQDFANQGFALIGGRIDYVDHRAVAALVYRHKGHVINEFVWPVALSDTGRQQSTRRGFNIVVWTQEGMRYSLVSDVNMEALEDFASISRAPNTRQPTRTN